MDTATSRTGPMPPGADLVVSRPSVGRCKRSFSPGPSSMTSPPRCTPSSPQSSRSRLSRPGPANVLGVRRARRTGFLPPTGRYTTDLERAARFPVADSPLAAVFDGHVLRIADLPADPGFVRQRDSVKAAGLRSAVIVPVMAGSRVIGELSAASHLAAAYDDVHVERLRTVGRMIGPFIDVIAPALSGAAPAPPDGLLSGITKMLGTTLDLREILAPVGEAVRPAIAFDAMGVIMLDTSGWKWAFFGTAGRAASARH